MVQLNSEHINLYKRDVCYNYQEKKSSRLVVISDDSRNEILDLRSYKL